MLKFPALILLPISLLLAACGGSGGGTGSAPQPPAPIPLPALTAERAFPALSFVGLVDLVQPPGDDTKWYAVRKGGVVHVFDNVETATASAVFLDISSVVDATFPESGLLSMAFHPDYPNTPFAYLYYTATGSGAGGVLVSRLSRFTTLDGGLTLDPATETVLLAVDQPFANHNGGRVAFGPDGMLYMSLGDGGGNGDPQGNAQNTQTLLGSILRIGVNGVAPYSIPPGNPFASGGGRAEIYAYGFRNPWRWSIDGATGALWCADVGEALWEEVDLVTAGGNYGWNIREGAHCFGNPGCSADGLIDPVAEYGHEQGCSITGGHVWRSVRIPRLDGVYLYSDACSGNLWGLPPGAAVPEQLGALGFPVVTMAIDTTGEVYLVEYPGGRIYRLNLAASP